MCPNVCGTNAVISSIVGRQQGWIGSRTKLFKPVKSTTGRAPPGFGTTMYSVIPNLLVLVLVSQFLSGCSPQGRTLPDTYWKHDQGCQLTNQSLLLVFHFVWHTYVDWPDRASVANLDLQMSRGVRWLSEVPGPEPPGPWMSRKFSPSRGNNFDEINLRSLRLCQEMYFVQSGCKNIREWSCLTSAL